MQRNSIKGFIDTIKDDYDFIILDNNPSLDNLPINALTASDKVIIPVQAEPFGIGEMVALLQSISKVQKNLNKNLEIEGILITMTDIRTNLSKLIISQV